MPFAAGGQAQDELRNGPRGGFSLLIHGFSFWIEEAKPVGLTIASSWWGQIKTCRHRQRMLTQL